MLRAYFLAMSESVFFLVIAHEGSSSLRIGEFLLLISN